MPLKLTVVTFKARWSIHDSEVRYFSFTFDALGAIDKGSVTVIREQIANLPSNVVI